MELHYVATILLYFLRVFEKWIETFLAVRISSLIVVIAKIL